jgi:hypothetical protein
MTNETQTITGKIGNVIPRDSRMCATYAAAIRLDHVVSRDIELTQGLSHILEETFIPYSDLAKGDEVEIKGNFDIEENDYGLPYLKGATILKNKSTGQTYNIIEHCERVAFGINGGRS